MNSASPCVFALICGLAVSGCSHDVEPVPSTGSTAQSGAKDGTVRVWDIRTGKTLAVLTGHQKPVHRVALSRDGSRLAS